MPVMISRVGVLPAAVLSCLLIAPIDVSGQAWTAPKGEGAVTVAYQNTQVENHLSATTPVAVGTIDSHVMLVDVTYGLTDRIGVDFSVPFVSSRYRGPVPHPGSAYDNGSFHGALSDLRFAVRYNLTRAGAVITPYIGTSVPSHDYVFFAHAAPGQRLKELQVGAYVAKLLDRGIPGLFVSGRYSYGFVEKVLDISHNRSSADLEVGYFISPSLRAFAMTSGQYSHGGIDFPLGGSPALLPQYRPVHDQIQRVHYVKVGAGLSYAVSDTLDMFGSVARQVSGRNGHEMNRGITVGASWGFSLRKRRPAADVASASRTNGTAASKREGSLVRCICQKS
jgi:hypothetical protein